MKKPQLQFLLFVVLIVLSIGAKAQENAKLDARWEVVNSHNGSEAGNQGTITLRLQIRCSSHGHRLNSGDFYIEYDSTYMLFNRQAERGPDYAWAPGFDPQKNSIYKFSKIVDFGTNPFDRTGNNLMDISIIDTSHNKGTLLDSGTWVDVVDLTWHIVKPG